MIFSGCGEPNINDGYSSEIVYDVENVSIVKDYHNSIKEYDFTYTYPIIEDTESEYVDTYNYSKYEEYGKNYEMKNYKDEMNGQREVRSARNSKYGYRNCYVIDSQHNECLYLTDEYI